MYGINYQLIVYMLVVLTRRVPVQRAAAVERHEIPYP